MADRCDKYRRSWHPFSTFLLPKLLYLFSVYHTCSPFYFDQYPTNMQIFGAVLILSSFHKILETW